MSYNFCRKHSTIKTTPAKEAGVTDRQWTLEEVVEMTDGFYVEKERREFETAFEAKFSRLRTFPKTFPQQEPKLPWYLDVDRDGKPAHNHWNASDPLPLNW